MATCLQKAKCVPLGGAGKLSEIPAFLDDHAHMLMARIVLLADGCEKERLEAATHAADKLIELFDDKKGGLLFTAKGAPKTIRAIRSCDDGPVPSGNGVAALSLLALGQIAGRTDYIDKAEAIIAGFCDQLVKAPGHAPTMSLALDDFHRIPSVVSLARRQGYHWQMAEQACQRAGCRHHHFGPA